MKKYLVIGIGNVVLSDDGIGPYVVRRAEELLSNLKEYVDYKENYSGGFDLIYDIAGYDKVLIVDSILTGTCEPGICITCTSADFDQLKSDRLIDSHGINLPTIIETGRRCGYKMPEEMVIFGIESEDVTTFSEHLTEKVEACIDDIVLRIEETLSIWTEQKLSILESQ